MAEILYKLAVKAEILLDNAIRNEEGPDRIAEIAEIAALANAAINQHTINIKNLPKLLDSLV